MSASNPHQRNAAAPVYFIADLHLDPEKRAAYDLALSFFKQLSAAQAVYILGDLFEYWIGDDAGLGLYQELIDELHKLSEAGVQVFVMLGNRDFLLGEEFAHATGVTLIASDELLISLADESVLLMHGDTLCTDDAEYQEFRQQLRSLEWRSWFLSQSIEQRTTAAKGLRKQSGEHSADKSTDVMDVSESSVDARMLANYCDTIIHGHTHRPAIHKSSIHQRRRIVVGDWHEDYAHYVVHDHQGLQLQRFTGQLELS